MYRLIFTGLVRFVVRRCGGLPHVKTMAEFVLPDVPVTQLLVRTRESIQIYDGPINSNGAISLRKAELFSDVTDLRICPLYSPDGSVVVYTFEKKVMSVHNTATGAQLFTLPIGDAEYVEFSPKGTFLVTWSRPTKGSATAPASADNGNFRVWSASTGALVTAFSLKVYKAQSIQWTANEEYCFRLVTNEIQIFRGDSLTVPIDKVYHKGLTQFRITSTVTPYVSVAAFNPESGGKPARVTLFRFNPKPSTETVSTTEESEKTDKATSVEGPVSSRTIFAASEAKLMWNAPGTALLVYAQADTDATSYYGATGLFLLQAHTDAAIKVIFVLWLENICVFVVVVLNAPGAMTQSDKSADHINVFLSFSPFFHVPVYTGGAEQGRACARRSVVVCG